MKKKKIKTKIKNQISLKRVIYIIVLNLWKNHREGLGQNDLTKKKKKKKKKKIKKKNFLFNFI